jgi:hypothetical protein
MSSWRPAVLERYTANSGPRALRPFTSIGRRAAGAALKPLAGPVSGAVEAGLEAVGAGLDFAAHSDAVRQVIAGFFESGLFDELVDHLLASPALWRLVDEIAASPAVTAAISQQGLGFADQVGDELRKRSRRADELVGRIARRIAHREDAADTPVADADAATPGAASPQP